MTEDAFEDGPENSDLRNLDEGLDNNNISDLGEVLEVLEQLEVDSLTEKVEATTIHPEDQRQLEELLDSFAVSPLPLPFLSDTEMQAVVEDLLEDLEDLQQDLDAILFREEERRKRVRKRAGLKKGDVIDYKVGELWFHVLVTGKGKATGKNRNYLNLMYEDGSQGGVYINKHEWRFSENPFMPWLKKVREEREAVISPSGQKEKVESKGRGEDFSLSEVSEDEEKKKKRLLDIPVLNLAEEGRTLSSCKETVIRGRKRHNSEREKREVLRVPETQGEEEEEVCTDGGGVVDKDRGVKVNCVVVITTKSEGEKEKIPGYRVVSAKRCETNPLSRNRKSHMDRKNNAAEGLAKNSKNDKSARRMKSVNSEIEGLEDSLSNMSIDLKGRGVGTSKFSDTEI